MKRLTPIAILISLSLAALQVSSAEWRKIEPPLEFDFPRDHGAHKDVQTEWWYFTGNLETESGRRFGYQFTFFRVGVMPGEVGPDEPSLTPRHLLAGHFAIADIQTQEFHFAERMRRLGAGYAQASIEDMHVWLGDWELQRLDNDVMRITAADVAEGIEIDFTLMPSKPLVFQEDDGYSKKGDEQGNASAYISWTRIATRGELAINGEMFEVSGDSWFDHEWGSSQLGEGVEGWDWFGLHLDDGRDLMIYGLRKNDGSLIAQSGGTLVELDGTAFALTRDDFTMEYLSHWESPHTGAVYPAKFRIEIPRFDIDFVSTPLLPDSEVLGTESLGVVYWEGPVDLSGGVTGRGYMELSGYSTDLAGRF